MYVCNIPDFRVDADIADELKPAHPNGNTNGREQWKHLHVYLYQNSKFKIQISDKPDLVNRKSR